MPKSKEIGSFELRRMVPSKCSMKYYFSTELGRNVLVAEDQKKVVIIKETEVYS